MTANSVTSVSLDPLLILVCLMREARTALAIQHAERLRREHPRRAPGGALAALRRPGQDHFEGLDVVEGPHGLPLLPAALRYLTCQVTELVQAGDHDIVFAEVDHCAREPERRQPRSSSSRADTASCPGMTRLG